MKAFLIKTGAVAAAMLASFPSQAQVGRITGGQAVITLTPAFLQQLSSFGVTLTDLAQKPLAGGVTTLPTLEGLIDLQNGNGELVFQGGFQVAASDTNLRVEDIAFQINGTTAVFSGAFLLSGRYAGRQDIFVVNRPPAFQLPLQVQGGTIALPLLSLGLAPGFANLLNQAAGRPVLNAANQVGTAAAQPVVIADQTAP